MDDTIVRVITCIEPRQFQPCFIGWMQAVKVEKGGDYLLAVKDNHPTLAKAVIQRLSESMAERSKRKDIHFELTYGRTEAREYHGLPAGKLTQQFPEWKGLKCIGIALGYRMDKSGKESLEYRYYISSAALNKEQFKQAIRSHCPE
ncbi:ISAs1 family transposase [Xenorhabdus bovienii]|uniref:ISAs1 family transposase n=2 Tax=Xenorhabdus bovienii TaxID=40576 RepID=UPI0023B267D7|nr:ISAs1 family transposase [Xenorhabdus bovienii]MDE9455125.1 ISAs1 family transposase [Xenorhabdus bovienii]MDE9544374.1 ISAs1 family transposase [Xenorhabdus bovienii]MDE9565194.1 ISAs1 family transposase [Xenorhabdus bovienii]